MTAFKDGAYGPERRLFYKPFDMDELIARIASLIRRYTRFNQQAGAIQKLNLLIAD